MKPEERLDWFETGLMCGMCVCSNVLKMYVEEGDPPDLSVLAGLFRSMTEGDDAPVKRIARATFLRVAKERGLIDG